MDDEEVVVIALAVYAMQKLKTAKKRRNRTIWVKPYLADRVTKSNYQLVQDLQVRLQDKEEYRAYLRMDTDSFTVSLLLFRHRLCDFSINKIIGDRIYLNSW